MAKNVLAVGNVGDAYYYDSSRRERVRTGFIVNSSSRGPTLDGRVKPNVAAPGKLITAPRAGTQRSYTGMGGTSMAAPHVAGLAATLMDHYPWLRGKPSVVRAWLMTSTMPGAYGRSRYKHFYGYGVVSSWLAHYDNRDRQHGWTGVKGSSQSASNGRYKYMDVVVPRGASKLVVTLTWDEPPASSKAIRAVQYNLDLWVDRIGGGVSCGSRGACGEYASASRTDNVEQVVVPRPAPGRYRIKVFSKNAYVVHKGRTARLPLGVGVLVVRGSTPSLSVTARPSSVAVRAGAAFNVRTTLKSSSGIAGGVTQYVIGGNVRRVQTTRRDGVEMNFTGTSSLTVGDIPYGSSRSVLWTIRAPRAPGLYRVRFRSQSLNGRPSRDASSLVRVTGASGRNSSKATATANAPDAGAQGLSGFTDDPIVPGVTAVKAAHWNELRIRIDGLRSVRGLPAFNWTDQTVGSGVPISAMHLAELRTALNQAYDGAGVSRPSYTDAESGALAGGTVIKAIHVEELRLAVAALEEW